MIHQSNDRHIYLENLMEAKATAQSGRVGGQLDIFGLQIEAGLSRKLGSIGGRLGVGLRPTNDGKTEFYFGSGFALGYQNSI